MSDRSVPALPSIGDNVSIGPNVTIEDGAVVGRNVTLVADVLVKHGAFIGDNAVVGYRDSAAPAFLPVEERLVTIGENAKVRSGVVLYWGVTLGDRSHIGHNAVVRERTRIGSCTYIGVLAMMEGDAEVGDHVSITPQCHITKYSFIGDYAFFGPMVVSANDNAMAYRRRGHGKGLKGFIAEKFVRVGAGAKLMAGVRLQEGCVVGAGSVVTRDVPAYKVVVGVPARVVRDALRDDNPGREGGPG